MNRILLTLIALSGLYLASCTSATPPMVAVQDIPFPGGAETSLPSLSSDGKTLILSWVATPTDSLAQFYFARLGEEGKWSSPERIAEGSNWFVNWADYPALVQNKGSVLAYHLQKSSPGKFSYDILIHALPQGQENWRGGLPLHRDSTQTEHGFVSATAYSDSSFLVSWLDGRNTGGGGHEGHDGHSGAMSIRAAEVTVQGKVLWDSQLDDKTCDCCQTSTAITSQGPVVVYRNRSDQEIRDIAITRLVDGDWTEPNIIHTDGWEISGCPVNGPKVVAQGKRVLVGWFTAAKGQAKVNFSFSSDAGGTFGAPIAVEGQGIIGRVEVALLDEQSGIASWMETNETGTYLMAARIDSGGTMGMRWEIGKMDSGRKSGFPQLEVLGDAIYFAWTEVQEDANQVRTAFLPKSAFMD
ncbi:MAG: hypothetical protein O3A40_03090 [Bacteroidetes bacterium]|nr:hypothetical protein [Bacteroidota bacterium]